jgi:hypothetical protein
VAEHIDEKYSDILLASLTGSSSVIIFTAAPPGQPGKNHINLKPYYWWIEKFKKFGFEVAEKLTNYLKNEMKNIKGMQEYYFNNLYIFKKDLQIR